MNANFIRKPSNRNELLPSDEFVIEKTIELDNVIFEMFLNNLLDDHDFIKENIDLMYCDENNVMHCNFVTTKESDFGVLIESEGYSYARYCAYLPKILLKINEDIQEE